MDTSLQPGQPGADPRPQRHRLPPEERREAIMDAALSAFSDLGYTQATLNDVADRLGVTLVGFLRGDSFNIYTHDGRVDLRDLLRQDLLR